MRSSFDIALAYVDISAMTRPFSTSRFKIIGSMCRNQSYWFVIAENLENTFSFSCRAMINSGRVTTCSTKGAAPGVIYQCVHVYFRFFHIILVKADKGADVQHGKVLTRWPGLSLTYTLFEVLKGLAT